MPDTTERPTATTSPPRPGLGAPWVLIGLGFLIAGAVMVALLLRSINASAPDSPLRRNTWMPLGFCSIFLLMGLSYVASGVRSAVWRRRLARLAAAHPGEPWSAEFEWNAQGHRERVLGPIVRQVLGIGFVFLLLSPFNYWAFAVGGPWPLIALVSVGDLLVLAGVAAVARRLLRKLRYGAAFISYARFPFLLGERLEVRVGTARPLPASVPLEARLRVIKERRRRSGFGHTSEIDQYQLYEDTQTVAFDGLSSDVAVAFPLPVDGHGTDLGARSRTWWELHLRAKVGGADFDERFVVPVYRRPEVRQRP